MAITVKDLRSLPSASQFRQIAGWSGMDRVVTSAGIIDYEFVPQIDYDLETAFEPESFLISSLLFAKDDPSLLLPAFQLLNESRVAGIAYKKIIFDELPEEVIQYADSVGLPLFCFEGSTWFEHIIFEIMAAVETDDERHLSEKRIDAMIRGELSKGEIGLTRSGISLKVAPYISATYIKENGLDTARILRSFYITKGLKDNILVSRYDGGLFLLATSPKSDLLTHRRILADAMELLSIPADNPGFSTSEVHPRDEFDLIFREGYYTWCASKTSEVRYRSYNDIGIFQFLIPLSHDPNLQTFSRHRLDRLDEYQDTALSYIKNGGDISACAAELHCHPNTIRYRLARIKELLETPNLSDHELYRDLSIAFGVYLLNQ